MLQNGRYRRHSGADVADPPAHLCEEDLISARWALSALGVSGWLPCRQPGVWQGLSLFEGRNAHPVADADDGRRLDEDADTMLFVQVGLETELDLHAVERRRHGDGL